MKKFKDNPFLIYNMTIIGIICYFVLSPLRVNADPDIQSEITSKTAFDMSLLFWAIGIVGGCIAVTLIYVGYRKYKGEEKEEDKQSTSQHNSK